MKRKEGLGSRVRGWFPQEHKLNGKCVGVSSDLGSVPNKRDYSSLREALTRKMVAPYLVVFIAALTALWYLVSNKLINDGMFFLTGLLIQFCSGYFCVLIDLYVKRALLCLRLFKTAVLVLAVSFAVIVVFWFSAINTLISLDTFFWGSLSTFVLSAGYYFVVDQYARWKLRRSENVSTNIPELKP